MTENKHRAEIVRRILAENYGKAVNVIKDEDRIEALSGDSLDLLEAVLLVEAEFDIQINDDELAKVATVGDFIKLIEDHP